MSSVIPKPTVWLRSLLDAADPSWALGTLPPMRPIRQSIVFLSALRLLLNTAFRFVYPFLPVIARGLGVPLEQAALLLTTRHLAGLATPAINRLVGKGEHRLRLISTGIAFFVAGCAVTVLTGAFMGALVGFALLGLSKPVFDVSSQAYISDHVPYARRARYLASFEFTWAIALLIGAPLAGWLISKTDWSTPFLVLGLLAALGMFFIPRFIESDGSHTASQVGSARFTGSALAFLIAVGLFSMASEIIFVVFGAWMENSFAVSITALGAAAFVIAAAELVGEGGTFAFTDRIGKRRAVLGGLLVSIIGFGLLAFAGDSMGLGLGLIAIAIFGFEFTYVSSIPLASGLVPGARARYLGWMVVGIAIGRSVGAAVGPVLFGGFDLAGPAILAMLLNVVAFVVVFSRVRDVDVSDSRLSEAS